MPNSEAEKDAGAGAAAAFDAWVTTQKTPYPTARVWDPDVYAAFLAGWAARGKADAQEAQSLAAELDADALTCKANPLNIAYQAHEVLRLQERRVSECVQRIRSLDAAPSPAPTDTKEGGE